MSDIINYTKGTKNPINVFRTLDYNLRFAKDNPDYFWPVGIWCFCGPQGSGKTLSMVQTLKEIVKDYPKAKICSNIEIKGIPNEIIPFTDYSQLSELSNGIYGIIFVLDELHVIWNSLESKEIPFSEMACFCQMRKDRRMILGTSQVYSRIAKPIREQLMYVVDCHNFFGLIQFNKILDPSECVEINGHIDAKCLGNQIWFHKPELYQSYDTLFKIERMERKEKRKNGRVSKSVIY